MDLTRGWFCPEKNTFSSVCTHAGCQSQGVLVASGEQRPGVLDTLQRPGQTPQQGIIWPKALRALSLGNLD